MKRLFYRNYTEHDHADWQAGDDPLGERIDVSFRSGVCPNCREKFKKFTRAAGSSIQYSSVENLNNEIGGETIEHWLILMSCSACGWWQLTQKGRSPSMPEINWWAQYHSVLEKVAEGSDRLKMIQLREQLLNNWPSHRNLHPGKAEELVKGLLQEHLGCDVIHASGHVYQSDDGIDLYLAHNNSGELLGAVQVKRRINGNPESVSEVREFVGALTLKGLKKGIFVTTADRFTDKAKAVPDLAWKHASIELDLMAADRVLELLKVTTPTENLLMPMDLTAQTNWESEDGVVTTRQIFEANG